MAERPISFPQTQKSSRKLRELFYCAGLLLVFEERAVFVGIALVAVGAVRLDLR